MRIILKPVGLLFVLSGFVLLVIAAVWRNRASATVPATVPLAAVAASSSKSAAAIPLVKAPLPPGVLLVPDIASGEWQTMLTAATAGSTGASAVFSVVDASVPGHPHARQINVRAVNGRPWEVQLARPLSVPLKKGKQIRLSFWGRSKESCPVTAVVEQKAAPYAKVVYQVEALTPEWKSYTQEWIQPSDAPENWAKMDFQLGHKVGNIEITGVVIRQIDGK